MEKREDPALKLEALHKALDRLRVPPAYHPGKWFVGPVNFLREVRSAMNLPDRVEICDVTLREAPQTYFTEKEYIAYGMASNDAGVSVIQFLSPRGDEKDAASIKALKELGRRGLSAKLQVYGVNSEREMDQAAELGVHNVSYTIFPIPEWQPIYSSRRVIPGGSELLEKAKSVKDENSLIEYMEKMAEAVKRRGMKPRPIANFFSMASIDFLKTLAKACERAGVFALNFVDAAGNVGPAGYRYVVSEVKKAAPGLTVGIHAHNDLGLAVANAVAGVEAGAAQVDVTVNGVGERTGNTTMAEVVVALEALYDVPTGIKLEKLTPLAKLFADMARWPIPRNMPLVGEYAFTDSSETHSFLQQADPLLFAPVTPELVGNKRRSHLDLKSGIHTLKMRLRELNLVLPEAKLPDLMSVTKAELMLRRRPLTEEEMRDLVDRIRDE